MKALKLYSLLIMLLCGGVRAQDLTREIININKSFYETNEMAMDVTVKYFVDGAPSKEYTTSIYKMPGKYLYKTSSAESMANQNYKINIDHQKKVMVINKVTNHAPKKLSDADLVDKQEFKLAMDTVLTYYKSVDQESVDAQQAKITFRFKQGMYDYVTITYDKKTYRVNEYFIQLNADAVKEKDKSGKKHQYTYKIINHYLDKSQISKKVFDENNYIQVKNHEILPSSKYTNYKLVNNTNTSKS